MSDLIKIIQTFQNKHLLVIGDLVLDQYIKGSVTRISPEAPVPIVRQEKTFYTPGGAANVANNLASLGAKVTIFGLIGDDIEGNILKEELVKRSIDIRGVIIKKGCDTIFKTRIIAQHQQVVRLDREHIDDFIDPAFKKKELYPKLQAALQDVDGVVISDYGKGVVDSELVKEILKWSEQRAIPVLVDPKVEHLKSYGRVTSITPNKKEAEEAFKALPLESRGEFGSSTIDLSKMSNVIKVGQLFLDYLQIESMLITLGEHGMYLFETHREPYQIDTRAREVYDVSGAGDTVIAVFTLAIACGADKRDAAELANFAAGVVVGKEGAVAISRAELEQAIGL